LKSFLLSLSLLTIIHLNTCAFQAKKVLLYQDQAYETTIKTIQLLPDGNSIQSRIAPSIKKLNDGPGLVLEFDDLRNDADYFFVRFIHCNADWSPSDLRANMYLNTINEFEIEDFEFSQESKIPYVHYKFRIPNFKVPGNYLAIVYRDRKKDDLILSKQFMVYENQVGVGATISLSSSVGDRQSHQRVEVTMNYGNLNSLDPRKDFKIIVRQNQRSDRELVLAPTFINENDKVIRYQNLGDQNDFPGGNEFRYFDLSTINFKGRNVVDAGFIDNRPYANLATDEKRSAGYFHSLDLNGQFYIRDLEGGGAFATTSEYIQTTFSLKTEKSEDEFYVLGGFNFWQKTAQSRLKWNSNRELYETEYLLKQGWYDYAFISANDLNYFEQSFFQTENTYEVFVYFRPIGARGDELVGYYRIDYNNRR
jgi:hypothetical protein